MKKLSKKEAEEKIKDFFSSIKSKTPEEIRKMKKLSMRYGLKLGDLRKTFCKKCLHSYSGEEKVRIKNKMKTIKCGNCDYTGRWQLE